MTQLTKRNKRIAFDCSILIIIKNNLNHHITIKNNLNHTTNNSNNKCNNLNQVVILKLIDINKFGEIYLSGIKFYFILEYIIIRIIYSIDIGGHNISTYKYRNYFNNSNISNSDENNNHQQNISNCCPMPSTAEKIEMNCSDIILVDHWIPDTCKSIKFTYFDQQLTRNIIGNSLTSINFSNEFNQSLSDTKGEPWLPRTLKSLTFGKSFQHSIHRDEMPPSLTTLIFIPVYKGVIQYGSIPKSVTTLHYSLFFKEHDIYKFDLTSVPGGTTSLEFDFYYNGTIEKGMIPHYVTSLKFRMGDYKLEPNSLPISIKTLGLGRNRTIFTQKVFPPTITNLSIVTFSDIGILPKTIEKLKIIGSNNFTQLDSHSFHIFENLKSLELNAIGVDLTGVEFSPTIIKLTLTVL
ncbi:hypothetical protein DDB_G0274411 [Dictyostelium discoideum AX4]|uniref:FNIP repeat-containing protein n=1 Tax=Dictyostelium discoideum TaxID=44689 RepID=Q86HU4_DICDI|nr:hypothetical protein DDB_G0274411 [Dictyostelium discoideum AX4]EAL70098.1 hypothetical protein DDB_G0274411 [Dictyostelium discoideum AX4]|eukprot:XP_644212.1 hypothetical protein DDB_G0274411 [Dictyostelium discoideum AX4]